MLLLRWLHRLRRAPLNRAPFSRAPSPLSPARGAATLTPGGEVGGGSIPQGILDHASEFDAIRKDLHAHPELGFEETRTASVVASALRSYGVDVVAENVGRTGVVGTIRGREVDPEGASIGLRADMDALPIAEASDVGDVPHISTAPGVMHACGHDGHTATLLAAARQLCSTRNFRGECHVIFQPNEEGVYWPDGMDQARDGSGAEQMVRDGLFDRFPCDAVFGLHNWPGMPVGQVGVRAGPLMGSEDNFTIRISGKGGHAAMPHRGVDPLLCGAQVVTALQSLVSRNADPDDGAVVSVTQFNAPAPGCGEGSTNIIADDVELSGTIRCFKPDTRAQLQERLHAVVNGTCSAAGATAEILLQTGYPSTVNDALSAEQARSAAASIVGAENVVEPTPTSASEDFAIFLENSPGCYLWIGSDEEGRENFPLHHPQFDFNDKIIPIGSGVFVRLVEQLQPCRV